MKKKKLKERVVFFILIKLHKLQNVIKNYKLYMLLSLNVTKPLLEVPSIIIEN
jgi:hypothetical protein